MKILRIISVTALCMLGGTACTTTTTPQATESKNASPPKSIVAIIHKHERGKLGGTAATLESTKKIVLQRSDFTKAELAKLDAFAAKVSGHPMCQIIVAYGCGSCCADGQRANHVNTTCGWQCWNCYGGPCG